MKRLDPTLDLVFRQLLTRESALLEHMLESILGRSVQSLIIIDPDLPGEVIGDKEIILDIRVTLTDGTHVDVEMQVRAGSALGSRLVYYASRTYTEQLSRGDSYHRLTPSIVIVWLVDPLFPDIDRLHSIFELRERYTHRLFGDQLSLHVLQLKALSKGGTNGYDDRVGRWARFFVDYDDDSVLQRLADEDPIMSLAKQTLDAISADPEIQRKARERADALKFYEIDLATCRAEAEAKGRAEGEALGRAGLLLKQIGLRFGDPSEAVRSRVEAATLEEVDAWGERILIASSLDDLFSS